MSKSNQVPPNFFFLYYCTAERYVPVPPNSSCSEFLQLFMLYSGVVKLSLFWKKISTYVTTKAALLQPLYCTDCSKVNSYKRNIKERRTRDMFRMWMKAMLFLLAIYDVLLLRVVKLSVFVRRWTVVILHSSSSSINI